MSEPDNVSWLKDDSPQVVDHVAWLKQGLEPEEDHVAWLKQGLEPEEDHVAWLKRDDPDPAGVHLQIPKYAETASRAASKLNLDALDNSIDRTDRELAGTPEGEAETAKLMSLRKQFSKVGGREGDITPLQDRLVGEAEDTKDPRAMERSKFYAGQFRPPVPATVGENLTDGAKWLGEGATKTIYEGFDAAARRVRAATNPDVQGYQPQDPRNDFEPWMKSVENYSAKRRAEPREKVHVGGSTGFDVENPGSDPVLSDPLVRYERAVEGIGKIGDTAGAVLGAAGGYASDAMGHPRDPKDPRRGPSQPQPDLGAAVQTVLNPERGPAKSIATQLTHDPLSYLGGWTKGVGPATAGQMGRAVQFSGGSLDMMRAAKAAAMAAAEEHAGTTAFPKVLSEIAAQHGASPAETARVFGKNFEAAGQSGLELGFMGKGATELPELAAKLGVKLPENLAVKAGERAREFVQGARYLDPHQRQTLQGGRTIARHMALSGQQRSLEDYGANVAPQLSPVKAERETLNRYHVDPALGGLQLPRGGLTDKEAGGVDALSSFYGRQHEGLVSAGVIDPEREAKNAISGQYTPRQFLPKDESFAGAPGIGKGAGPLNARTADVALGTEGIEKYARIPFDPHEIVTNYAPKVERAKSRAWFERYVGDNFAQYTPQTKPPLLDSQGTHIAVQNSAGATVYVPRHIAEAADQAFSAGMGQVGKPSGPVGKVLDAVMDHFKKINLFPMPRYHVNNIIGDSVLAFANGASDPGMVKMMEKVTDAAVPAHDIILRSPSGKAWTKAGVQRELQLYGVEDGGLAGAMDLSPFQSKKKTVGQFQEASERAADGVSAKTFVKNRLGAGARDIASGGVPGFSAQRAGEALATRWEKEHNIMIFLDRLNKGDSPRVAALRLREIKPDYSDKGPIVRQVRRVFPFAHWQMNTLQHMPKTVARSPYAVNLLPNLAQSFAGAGEGEIRHAPPAKVSERAPSIPLGTASRKGVLGLIEAMSGDKLAPNTGVRATIRSPVADAAGPPVEAAFGNIDPLMSGMGPGWRTMGEYIAKKDLMTGQKLDRMDSNSIFAPGTPGVPESLQSRTGQANAMRYLPQLAASPWMLMAGNELGAAASGESVPVSFGSPRPYAEFGPQQRALAAVNAMTGVPLTLTYPSSQYLHLYEDPELNAATKIPSEIKSSREKADRRKNRSK